jgi:hypothetical protein
MGVLLAMLVLIGSLEDGEGRVPVVFERFSSVASQALPVGGAASLPMRPLRSPDPNEVFFENQSAWI